MVGFVRTWNKSIFLFVFFWFVVCFNLMRNIETLSEIFHLETFHFTSVLHVDVCQL